MTAYISDEIVDKIKDNIDIVNIVSDYVQLKKTGSNYVGLCPFHNEKSPSFTVSESKQFFHCFGCGEGGDGVTFIMKKENLDFPDALKFLADKLGIEIENSTNVNPKYSDEKLKTYEINKETARFYYDNLIKNPHALSYLEKRKLSSKVIRQFGLGYSLDSWDSLYKYLKTKNYSDDEIEKTGLIGRKSGNNGYYDKFRNRIMFPIIDTKSRIIGFGGRVLDKSMPKYLNSPDTIVFNKGNHLYGLNLLSKYSTRKRILLVEGYMDVISLYNRGINYSIASLGTAFTERQSKLLKRFGEDIYICYDSDAAGIKATLKAIDVCLKDDINPKIILLPTGMDPDDFMRVNGPIEFEKMFLNALNYIDYKINLAKSKYNLKNLDEKINFTKEVAQIIKGIKSPIEQDGYIEKAARETGISKDAIEREIKGNNKYNKEQKPKQYNVPTKESIKPIKTVLPVAGTKAETDLLKLMIKEKDYYEYISNKLNIEDFDSQECKYLYNLLAIFYENHEIIDENELINNIMEIPNLDKVTIESIFDKRIEFQATNINQVIDDLIKAVKDSNLLSKRKELLIKIENLEKKNRTLEENNDFNILCMELIEINKKINQDN